MSNTSIASYRFAQKQKLSLRHVSWVCCKHTIFRWLRLLGTALVLLIVHGAASSQATYIDQAHATIDVEGGEFWSGPVCLPYQWDKHHPGTSGTATFRFAFPVDDPELPWALYIPRLGNQAEVWIDGRLMTTFGDLKTAQYDAAKEPRLVEIGQLGLPLDRWVHVEIRIKTQASRWGGMTGIYTGPAADIRAMFEQRYHWRQFGALSVTTAMALSAIMAFGLWYLRRETAFGVFALGAISGALRFGDRLIHVPPIPWPWWGGATAVALIAYVVLMAWFSMLIADAHRRWAERLLVLVMVPSFLLALASFFLQIPKLWDVALAVMAVPSLTAFGLVLHKAWTDQTRESIGVSAAGALVMLAGFRDWLSVRIGPSGSEAFSILPHASMLFVVLVTWVMVERYARHARNHQQLLLDLESKVRERERQLELSNQRLRDEHARQAALVERQRIMRDIHDGVGAQLVGLLNSIDKNTAPRDELASQVRGALDELRMTVDALQPVHDDLATVLATLRYRLQPRLEEAGIQVEWEVDALPPMPGLTPAVVLEIQRILLEAFTNVMRHANATKLRVSATFENAIHPAFVLTVEDNGVGLSQPMQPGMGHGLSNMRARTMVINAKLSVTSGKHGGTCVRLDLPLVQKKNDQSRLT